MNKMETKIRFEYLKPYEGIGKRIKEIIERYKNKEKFLLGMEIIENIVYKGEKIVREGEFISLKAIEKEKQNNFWLYIVLNNKKEIKEAYKSEKEIEDILEFNEIKKNGAIKFEIKEDGKKLLAELMKKSYLSIYKSKDYEISQTTWSINKYFIHPIDALDIIEIEDLISKDNINFK